MALPTRTRTLDEKGHRKWIQPLEVKGIWQSRRRILRYGLIVFFLALPWLRIQGRPALLLNIFERKFFVFGLLFQAHDVPLLFLLVFGFILFFGLLTTLFGRVWCGWACPQTVFIEGVFRKIEKHFRGPIRWVLYVLATLLITHSFLSLFVGPDRLREMIVAGPSESPIAFLFIVVSSAIVLLDFGWFREQFCIVACPYGRLQSIFQDEQTITVAYDHRRGEPRGTLRESRKGTPTGDCVDCLRCVRACPTGIDIRNGSSQLECIACTACIDACDEVMRRLERRPGLIRYASLEEIEGKKDRNGKSFLRRGRVWGYFVLFLGVMGTLAALMGNRDRVDIEILKTRGVPFVRVDAPNGNLFSNSFVAEMISRSDTDLVLHFSVPDESASKVKMAIPNGPIRLKPGQILRQPMTLVFSTDALDHGKGDVRVRIRTVESGGEGRDRSENLEEKEVRLVGPY